jgi:predicted DNA-binding transcriptional regulator AlpA
MSSLANQTSGDALISLDEVGQMLGGISKKTVLRRIAAGTLPKPVKEGKFSRLFRSDVVRHIEQLKEQRDKKYGVRNFG